MLDVPELLLFVLRHLDAPSLSNCSRVCRRWYEPSTELMWAQAQKLEYLFSKLIRDEVQDHFRRPLFRYLSMKPESQPVNLINEGEDAAPTQASLVVGLLTLTDVQCILG
jgi:hypothetical protein